MRRFPESSPFPRQSLTVPVLVSALICMACDRSTNAPPGPVDKVWTCTLKTDSLPPSSPSIGCLEDYRALAAQPLDGSIPGAWSVKTVIDRADGERLYFLDTRKYHLHYEFASEHLSGNGKPLVRSISEFGLTEYYTPHRRFILGSLSRYESRYQQPPIWVWEMTPSDNAGVDMMALAYRKIAEACFCGKDLYFHATSLAIEIEAAKLPASVKVIPTSTVYQGVDYQALNYATGIGRLVFTTAAKSEAETPGLRDIVVLDDAPDDLPPVSGIITQSFQTPLSHLTVLSQDRGIPNMALKGALSDGTLRALEGKWAKLTVNAFGYSLTEATREEADAWWDAHKPAAPSLPAVDTSVRDLRDVEEILDLKAYGAGEALKRAIPAFGGRAVHIAAFSRMEAGKVPYEKSFGIPAWFHLQHMRKAGLEDTVDRMLADPAFKSDPAERERRLKVLREAVLAAPMDSTLWKALNDKLDAKFPGGGSFRFLASPNSGGLDSLSEAGLYASRTGGRSDQSHPLGKALLEVWAGVWDFRAFEERSFRGIDHKAVGMAVLVQADRPGAAANGVALTANPFDPAGLEPGFYINAQAGDSPVTRPDPARAGDQFIYHYGITGQPVVLISRADPSGRTTVLTPAQTYALGTALQEIHRFFQPLYAKNASGWYAMHVEFKLDQAADDPPGAPPVILLQEARPYRGWYIP